MLPSSVIELMFQNHRIHIAAPQEDALKTWYTAHADEHPFPYWAKVWPAAKALSEFILTHQQLIAGKKVMEIAAGLGLPSLTAAAFAKEVIITEADSAALPFINTSITLNALQNVQTKIFNWNEQEPVDDSEILLMSDVNYNPTHFPQLLLFVETQWSRGITILLSTPQRIMAKPFIEVLTPYITQQEEIMIKENGEEVLCSVFVLSKSSSLQS
ncbi:MAG: hypothetical protein K2X48_04380 [Chitinophagaceae bacterium]|nr:hypothetical protein [Chitinophagaceae bacterium]